MAKTVGVIDTSCVIALDDLNLISQLTFVFDRLLIPKAVRTEPYRRRVTKDRIRALLREYAFIDKCDDYNQSAVEVLLIERRSERTKAGGQTEAVIQHKDRGEAEVAVQAAEFGATAVVDDPWGRELAERYRLEYHGTIWILERLCGLELLARANLRRHLQQLIKRGIFLPLDAVNELLHRFGEKPI